MSSQRWHLNSGMVQPKQSGLFSKIEPTRRNLADQLQSSKRHSLNIKNNDGYIAKLGEIKVSTPLTKTEAQIRDLVAANLSGVDRHLRLLQTEHVVKRADGAEARIDILAKDDFGCYTVIEIKKSSQTSRSAVQQLYKYASFLKSTRRLEKHQIRCVIVSTIWDELLAPFGEFKHFSDYESIGYQLDFDNEGIPRYREIETSIELGGASPLSNFTFFEFRNRKDRDVALEEFTGTLEKIPSLNSVVISADYEGRDSKVINPFGFSWTLFSGNTDEVGLELAQLLPGDPMPRYDELAIDESLELDENTRLLNIRSKILINLVRLPEGEYASFALHSFNNIISNWRTTEPLGFGPMHSKGFFDRHELLTLASGFLGDHPYAFLARTSGERPKHVAAIRTRLNRFLNTNHSWRLAANVIFSELYTDEILDIYVFNPLNLFAMLNDLHKDGTSQRVPVMTITKRHANGKETIYRGALLWTMMGKKLRARDAVKLSYSDEIYFIQRLVNQRLNEYDEELSRLYGLTYEITRESEGKVELLQPQDGEPTWLDFSSIRTLQDFVNHNPDLIEDVGEYLGEVIAS